MVPGASDQALGEAIIAAMAAQNPDPARLWAGVMSIVMMLNRSSVDSVKRDLPLIDSICVPLAFALMGYMLRSPRLLIVASCNLAAVVLSTFGMLYVVCSALSMVPDPTQLNFVTIIALGLNFDYSLFLLDRFKSSCIEHRQQDSELAADAGALAAASVLEMLTRVTPVVVSSGLTLATVFCGFLFLSSGNLVGAGLGCAITVGLVMLVSLTMLPAMLHAPRDAPGMSDVLHDVLEEF